jgi:hypothetical protein
MRKNDKPQHHSLSYCIITSDIRSRRANMSFKIKVINKKTGCYIKLPEKFYENKDMKKHKELVGKLSPKGDLIIKRPLAGSDLCQICQKRPHKNNVCINCGKVTCQGCFWEMGSLCHDCLGK